MWADVAQEFPSRIQHRLGLFRAEIVERERGRVKAVRLIDRPLDEVVTRTALVGTTIDELLGIGLDPRYQSIPGLWGIRRVELGGIVAEQHLRTAHWKAVRGVEGDRVDPGIVGKPGLGEVGPETGLNGAFGQARIVFLEDIGVRIGVGLHRCEGALGDRLQPSAITAIKQVHRNAGVGRFEFRLDEVVPEIEDVGIGTRVPVDAVGFRRRHIRQQHDAGSGARADHEGATIHLALPVRPRAAPEADQSSPIVRFRLSASPTETNGKGSAPSRDQFSHSMARAITATRSAIAPPPINRSPMTWL